MAVLCRVGLLKTIINNNAVVCCKITPIFSSKRTIYGKSMRGLLKEPLRFKPFPYMERKFNPLDNLLDRSLDRLNANAKVIVVEGSVAAGKTALAKQIAEEFDMKHIPEPTMDAVYINKYGYDVRALDDQMPDTCKTYDHTNFCREPIHPNASSYQILMYSIRYAQYLDALTHLLNTGEGVVLERSPYSDYVFVDAMHENKFISDAARSVYYDVKKNTITELLRPHLVVYLDTPVNVIEKRIKERNYPHEQNSKALTTQYLTSLEKFYKTKFLKEISTHAELLVYDWTEPGETEIVLEDIERLQFDIYDHHDNKMQDWCFVDNKDLTDLRREYTNNKAQIMAHFLVPRYDVPEMIIPADDVFERDRVMEQYPGSKYSYGYNADLGDTGILFKTKQLFRGESYER